MRWGIPVTSPARTLIDLVRLSDRAFLSASAASGWSTRSTPRTGPTWSIPSGFAGPRRAARAARRPALRRILDERTFVYTASGLERRLLPLARRAGLPEPVTGTWIKAKVDFFWPEPGPNRRDRRPPRPPDLLSTGAGQPARPGARGDRAADTPVQPLAIRFEPEVGLTRFAKWRVCCGRLDRLTIGERSTQEESAMAADEHERRTASAETRADAGGLRSLDSEVAVESLPLRASFPTGSRAP